MPRRHEGPDLGGCLPGLLSVMCVAHASKSASTACTMHILEWAARAKEGSSSGCRWAAAASASLSKPKYAGVWGWVPAHRE